MAMKAEHTNCPAAEEPLVSVVSAYYNRQEGVIASINSLLKQTYQNLEILIIDDGSTDDTYQLLCSLQDPRLKVITQENIGFTRSIKRAVELTKGEYVAIHDAGDISLPERIAKQVAVLQNQPDVGVVGCYVETLNDLVGYSIPYRPQVSGEMTEAAKKMNPFTHGEVMFRRSVYDAVGGYREFFRYSQDYDLWLRMSLKTNFATVKETLYKRYIFPGGVSASIDKTVIQLFLADFAVQCINERIKSGNDFIDRYGEQAAFWRQRDRQLAIKLWKLAVKLTYIEDFVTAQQVNQLSLRESNWVINAATAWLIYLLTKYQIVRRLIAWIFTLIGKIPLTNIKRLAILSTTKKASQQS
jgi:glycosyltransferase involved in cell wall biosynthesis